MKKSEAYRKKVTEARFTTQVSIKPSDFKLQGQVIAITLQLWCRYDSKSVEEDNNCLSHLPLCRTMDGSERPFLNHGNVFADVFFVALVFHCSGHNFNLERRLLSTNLQDYVRSFFYWSYLRHSTTRNNRESRAGNILHLHWSLNIYLKLDARCTVELGLRKNPF